MAKKFFDQVGGVITLRFRGENLEKIINMSLARGIYIWNIKRKGNSIELQARSSGYEALKSLADENAFSMEVIQKSGLPFYKNILKQRLGFIGGILVFVMILYLASSFIWFVDVHGNEKIESGRVVLTAARHGVYQGVAKWSFSRTEVEKAILRDIPELSYVRLNIQGVKAHIEVVEKILPGKEITGPCHIVAVKDGVIEEILVLEGQASIKEGAVAAKGDILISGIVFPEASQFNPNLSEEELKPYLVRARGIVKARVWYEGYGECQLRKEKMILNGRQQHKIYIESPWKRLEIWGRNQALFPHYQQCQEKKVIKTPFGELGIARITFKEEILQVIEYTEREAIKVSREKAMKSLHKAMGSEQKITDSKIEILSPPSDPILRVKVSVETIEDIAGAKPVENGGDGTGTG